MKFIIEIKLPEYKNNIFQSMVAEQQQQINDLMQEKIIDMFSLNMAQTKVWLVLDAETKAEVDAILESFVTRQFMKITKVEPLIVYDSSAFQLPPLVLN